MPASMVSLICGHESTGSPFVSSRITVIHVQFTVMSELTLVIIVYYYSTTTLHYYYYYYYYHYY